MRRNTLIFVIGLFIVVPLAYFLFIYKGDYNSNNIKGSTTDGLVTPQNGFSLEVTSKNGTWDLYEYLCDTKEACLTSLMSGERFGAIGGGTVENREIVVSPSEAWRSYSFIKVYIRPGWGSAERPFNIVDRGKVPGTEIATIEYEGVEYSVILIPVEEVLDNYYRAGVFSDL